MKTRFPHSTAAFQCAPLLNLLISPDFLILKFYYFRETASSSFSKTIGSRFSRFGSIVNRDALVVLILIGSQFCEEHYCVDITLSGERNWINHP